MTDQRNDTGRTQATGAQGGRTAGRSARERAVEAYDSARGRASDATRKASDTLNEAPLIALAGGLAAGALIAALLPRTESEKKLLGPMGEKLTDGARSAAAAAREAGTARLSELGLTRDAGVETIRSILQGAGDAAKTSAQAALGAVRNRGE